MIIAPSGGQPVDGFHVEQSPQSPATEPGRSFSEVRKSLEMKIQALSSACSVAEKNKILDSIAEVSPTIFASILEEQRQRIEERKQEAFEKTQEKCDAKALSTQIYRDESARSKQIIEKEADELIGSVARAILFEFNEQILKAKAVTAAGLETKEIDSFLLKASKWLSAHHPSEKNLYKRQYVLSLLLERRLDEAINVLEGITCHFPVLIRDRLNEITSKYKESKIEKRQAILSLSKILCENKEEICRALSGVDKAQNQEKTLQDLLNVPEIFTTLLKYCNLSALILVSEKKDFIQSDAGFCASEYFNSREQRALVNPKFSLASSSKICRSIEKMAIVAIMKNYQEYNWIDERLKKNLVITKIAVLSCLKNSPEKLDELYREMPEELKKTIQTFAEKVISESTLGNRRLLFARGFTRQDVAFLWRGDVLSFAPFDEDVCRWAVLGAGSALQYASDALKNDPKIVELAVRNDGLALQYASDTLKNDRKIVEIAVKKHAYALQYASDTLKNDPKIVELAVRNYGLALEHASDTLKNDRKIVEIAVKGHGYALHHASEALKNDRKIVTKAVQNIGSALYYASEALKDDPEIVIQAVTNDGMAVQHASQRMRDNLEIVKLALAQLASIYGLSSNLYQAHRREIMSHVSAEVRSEILRLMLD